MVLPQFSSNNFETQWDRFCDLLWFDKELGIWLDVSRMQINNEDFEKYHNLFEKSFSAIDDLEQGYVSNIDENRQVGHYWLRNRLIAPNENIRKQISENIDSINQFGEEILTGKITNNKQQSFTDILWIGIGGSALGPLLIINSLQELGKGLNFHFIDNIDSEGISRQLNLLQHKINQTLVVVVSKSGGTPEPKLGMDQVRYFMENKGIEWSSHAVAVTMKDSQLDQIALTENWLRRFDLPDWIGGRTSITGAVGILPIVLVGSDIHNFLEGAAKMDHLTRARDVRNNPAALLALAWLTAGEAKGKRDMVVLPYKDRLEVFSRYLQQLIMESLGKKEDRNGNIVNQGISVYGNKGSTDQHAYVQQLRDGIDNFFVTFIEVLRDSNDIPCINGKNPGDYLSGFLQGTRAALSQGSRQNLTITIREFNEHSLGSLIALFERAVSLYAEIVNINAYHQPGVEAGKIAAADILKLQKEVEELLLDGNLTNIESLNNRIPGSNPESIFWILRHLVENNSCYSVAGSWSNPKDLLFKYNS